MTLLNLQVSVFYDSTKCKVTNEVIKIAFLFNCLVIIL